VSLSVATFGGHVNSLCWVWDVNLLEAVLETQPGGSTGGGGDASAANQVTGNASLASIDTKLSSVATQTTLASLLTELQAKADLSETQPVSGTVTVGALPATGALGHTTSGTAALTNVSSSASSVQLLASTAGRRMATIHNDSTAVLFLKYGSAASATSYTVKIPAGGYFEFPHPVYTGRVDGIWDAANGAARITEST
jgi:hypothetical protein